MPELRDLLSDAAGGPGAPFDADAVRRRVRQRSQRRKVAGGLAALAVVGLTAVGLTVTGDPDDRRDDRVVAGEPDRPMTTTPPSTPDTSSTVPSTTPGTAPSTTVPTSTPTTTTPPDPTATTQPAELEDGVHFGYLVGAEEADGRTVVRFDLAQWFEGDDADRAAQEDGAVGEGEEIENDVYIRNTNDRIRRVPVDPAVVVTVVDCDAGCESRPADLATLLARPQPTPVWIEVRGTVVTVADEQYLP